MTHDPSNAGDRDAHAFDDAMRRRHAAAVAHVSAATQAQLHQRRRAALASPRIAATGLRRYGWAGAASCALLLALALASPTWRQAGVSPVAAPPVAVAPTATDDGDPDDVLDENPDFYLWLGSADAQSLAME